MVYLYDACDQISDFCHQQLLRKMRRKISWTDGRTVGQMDRGKTVYPPPPSGSGVIKMWTLICINFLFQAITSSTFLKDSLEMVYFCNILTLWRYVFRSVMQIAKEGLAIWDAWISHWCLTSNMLVTHVQLCEKKGCHLKYIMSFCSFLPCLTFL